MFEVTLMYALSFLGTPYIYGGNGYAGIDCSGLCNEILKSVGILRRSEDLSSQGLYDKFSKDPFGARAITKDVGNLVFYGKSVKSISHCAFLMFNNQIIEAAGGNELTRTKEEAIKRNAFVRISHMDYRPDMVAIIKPNYKP